MKQKELIEALQKTVAMQAETIKALLQMVAELKHPLITVGPVPTPNTTPLLPWPPYTPYIGDPPGWLTSPNWGTAQPNIGIGGNGIGGTVPLATCSAQRSFDAQSSLEG